MNVNVTVELEIILCQHRCFCLVHIFASTKYLWSPSNLLLTVPISYLCYGYPCLGPNIQGTSNYGTGKVLIGNMLSWLCS